MDTTKIVEKIKYGNVELKMKTTTLQAKSVDPSVDEQFVFPDSEYGGLSSVTVTGVTNSIDKNIIPGNIRKGKVILGVEGDMEPDKPDQSKTIKPTKEEQEVHADRGYELLSVTVEGVTSDVDENIQPDNIRYGVEILGVVGSMEQKEDLDAELNAQESLLSDLQSQADSLPEIKLGRATATESDVLAGKTFFSRNTELKTGALEVPDLSATTATAEDVLQGKKFYNAQGEFVEGSFQNIFQEYADTMGFSGLFSSYPAETIPYLSKLDTSKATSMQSMFYACRNLISLDLSNFNTTNVTNMNSMFYNCPKLESLDLSSFYTSKVKNMEYMFYLCGRVTSLDLSPLDTSSVTSMRSMFHNVGLTSIDLSVLDTSSLTNMQEMFSSSSKIRAIDFSEFDTSNVKNMYGLFYYCSQLTDVHALNLLNATSASDMFKGCGNLQNLTLKNIKINLTTGSGWWNTGGYGYSLTNESLINTIQELWDNTDNILGGSRTLTISSSRKSNLASVYVKLIEITDEMRAEDPYVDNKKPCVVCESTDEGAMLLEEYATSKNWAIAYS